MGFVIIAAGGRGAVNDARAGRLPSTGTLRKRSRLDLEYGTRSSEGEALRPGRRPAGELLRREGTDQGHGPSGRGIAGGERAFEVRGSQRGQRQAKGLRAVTVRIDAEHDGQRGAGPAQRAYVLEKVDGGTREGREQAPPGEDGRHPVRDAFERW